MTPPPLKPAATDMVRSVFRLHPEVETVIVFGSCAKGDQTERSDVDLVVTGDVGPLRAESIAPALDELPLPCRFEVQPLAQIHHRPLLDHIQRIGIQLYPATPFTT